VNVLPGGALSGFAFSGNVGWINFEQTHGKPAINLSNGEFSGFAWSGNAGWINLGEGRLATLSINATDNDLDGIGDEYELDFFGDLTTANASTDFDRDGASDREEYAALSDPTDPADFLRIVQIAPSPNLSALFRIEFTSELGRVYSLETTTSFGQWTTVAGFENILPGPAGVTTVDIPGFGQSPPRYWRVRVRIPL
jgi:hypothetical protein